jgi:hypothetical protein
VIYSPGQPAWCVVTSLVSCKRSNEGAALSYILDSASNHAPQSNLEPLCQVERRSQLLIVGVTSPFHSLPWFLANKRRKLVRTPVNINESATIPFGNPAMKKNIWRAVIEVGFIIFLFYSNLLMGEFERSGMGQKRGLVWAIGDVLTNANFEIATIAALIGYILVEFLRKRF